MEKLSFFQKLINKLLLYKSNLILISQSLRDNFVISNDVSKKAQKKIIINYLVFGERFIDTFVNISLPSLLQIGNIPKIINEGFSIKFIVYTNNKYGEKLIKDHKNFKKLKKYLKPIIIIIDDDNQLDLEKIKKEYLDMAFEYAINNSLPIFLLSPEFFYGNESIYNVVNLIDNEKDFFLSSHARTDWNASYKIIKKKFEKKPRSVISNRELVNIALNNISNDQFYAFEKNRNKNKIYHGLNIKQIDQSRFAVSCSRLNPIFGGLLRSDKKFFSNMGGFNHYDFSWPRKLIKENRMKFIGDSDIFFSVELTEEHRKSHNILSKNEFRLNPYGGKYRLINHKINEMLVSFWKRN